MSRSDKLKAAIDDMATTIVAYIVEDCRGELPSIVSEAVTEIEAQLQVVANPGAPDVDVDAAIVSIRSMTSTIKTEVDRMKADNPPTP